MVVAQQTLTMGERKMGEREIGELIGNRYQLTQRLNSGGMGQVYKAIDTQLFDRVVAIKLLMLWGSPKLQKEMRRRFEEEAAVSVMLGEHPRIINIMDYGVDHDQPFIAMEYLGRPPKGWDLGELIQVEKGLNPYRSLLLLRQVCDGLEFAHHFQADKSNRKIRGVIHRDIKPANLFVLNEGRLGETIRILDFGIAKVISDTTLSMKVSTNFAGTPVYASPEQLRGEVLTPQSDVYSLGIVLFEMLSGQLPFKPSTKSFAGWYDAHNYQDPIHLNRCDTKYPIPTELEDLIRRCLAKDPARRPLGMSALTTQIDTLLPLVADIKPNQLPFTQPATPATDVMFTAGLDEPMQTGIGTHNRVQSVITPEFENHLQLLLSRTIGPIAPMVLQQAKGSTRTPEELLDSLVAELPTPQRHPFRQEAQSLLETFTSQPASSLDLEATDRPLRPSQGSLSQGSRSTDSPSQASTWSDSRAESQSIVSAAFIQVCEQELTKVVGPIAKIVIQQAVQSTRDLTPMQLIDQLVAEIPHTQKATSVRKTLISKLET